MARNTQVQYINYYMSGSAAYQVDAQIYRKKAQKTVRKPRKMKKIVVAIDPMAIAGIVVSVVMFVLLIVGVTRLNQVQANAQQMNAYVQTLRVENQQLQETYHSSYDIEEIRQIALARGMVSADMVQQIPIRLTVPTQQAEPTSWDNFLTFLTGLFA